MNPAAPVTSILTRASLRAALGALANVRRLVPLRLELLGALQVRDRLRATAAPVKGVAEVVVRVRLVRVGRARSRQLLHRLPEERHRAGEVALPDELVSAIVERVAVGAGRRLRSRR